MRTLRVSIRVPLQATAAPRHVYHSKGPHVLATSSQSQSIDLAFRFERPGAAPSISHLPCPLSPSLALSTHTMHISSSADMHFSWIEHFRTVLVVERRNGRKQEESSEHVECAETAACLFRQTVCRSCYSSWYSASDFFQEEADSGQQRDEWCGEGIRWEKMGEELKLHCSFTTFKSCTILVMNQNLMN